MKAFLFVLLLAQQAFSAQMVSEANYGPDCGSNPTCTPVKKAYAQVCIRNYDTRHNMVVRTTWGFGTFSMSRIPLNTQLVYRLVADESSMDKAAFQVTFVKSMETKEEVTLPLEIEWTDAPTVNCDNLPTYQFTIAKNAQLKEEFALTKVVQTP